MDPRSFYGLAGAAVVMGVVQVFKITFPGVPSNYYPLAVLVSAIGLNVGIAALQGTDLGLSVLVGIVTGLSASGLYSFGRASPERKEGRAG